MIARARLLLQCPHCGESKLIGVTIVDDVVGEVMCDSCLALRRFAAPESAPAPLDLDSSLLEITREPLVPDQDRPAPDGRALPEAPDQAAADPDKPRRWSKAGERRRFAALVVMSLGFTGHTQPYWIDVVDGDLAEDRAIDYSVLRRAADKHLRDRLVVELGISQEDVETYLPRDAALT